jgi:hypothetical protein
MAEMGSDTSLAVKESKINVNRRKFRHVCRLYVECETFLYQSVCHVLKVELLQFRNRDLLRQLGSPLALRLSYRGQKMAAAQLLGSIC